MKKILIIGGGFGGLMVAEKLGKTFGKDHQITLVSPNRKFTFYPALVRLAFGELDETEVVFDLAQKLEAVDVRFIEGEVLHLKPSLHRVQVAGKDLNGDLSYDYLVIAMGRRLATEKIHGLFDYAHHLLGVEAAEKFGKAVNEFKNGNIVVALAPAARLPIPVCETAFALSRRFLPDSPTKPTQITVVMPEKIEDAFGGAEIHKTLKSTFEKQGIELREDFPISDVKQNRVVSNDGSEIPFDLLMLIPPFRGQGRLSENDITDDEGFVEVDSFMRVRNMNNAYAVGDIVSFKGPKLAHIAVNQAEVVAENLASEIKGAKPERTYYHEIATIIDQGGSDSIYLHYGIWDDSIYRVKQGSIWGTVKRVHDKIWRTVH